MPEDYAPNEIAVEGIRAEKSQRSPQQRPWWWILGDTYPQRETLKRHGARFSNRRRAWYYVGWELPDGIRRIVTQYEIGESAVPSIQIEDDAPCSDEEAAAILGVGIKPKTLVETALPDGASPELQHGNSTERVENAQRPVVPEDDAPLSEPYPTEEPQHIRVFKPQPLATGGTPPDDVQAAIIRTKTQPMPVLHTGVSHQKRTPTAIGQSYVGELTGSITGNVYCYGYAVHDGTCVFVNMGGPRMAVKAIRAKFSKGDVVNCVPWDAPAVELTAGEGSTGMYHDFMQNIPEAKFTSVILCHELLVNPNYGGKSTTFILRTDDAQAAAKLQRHVTELVKVPVFDAWAGYLYHAGQAAMLVRKTRSAGDIDLLTVDLDIDAWTRLITGGLEQDVITLP